MPTREKPTQTEIPELHFLHRYRPVVTMGFGLSLLLAITILTLANLSPLQNWQTQNPSTQENKLGLYSLPSSWEIFQSQYTGLSFRHPKEWTVTEKKLGKDYVLYLQPDQKNNEKITIYISPSSFLGFDGLPTKTKDLNGYKVTSVDSSLFGIKSSTNYYTFDAGTSQDSLPVFTELANSVKIQ
jgi:hypothetical protein